MERRAACHHHGRAPLAGNVRATTMTYPDLPTTVGKHGKSVMPPYGKIIGYVVADEVRTFQDSQKTKVVIFQLMRFEDGRKEVRVGYYIIGKLPKMRGRWVWGQFAAFIPIRTFQKLVRKATKKGWFSA